MKNNKIRKIDTIDGEVLCKSASDSASNYVEFYKRDGYDDEACPYTFVCDSDVIFVNFAEMTDDELEDLYYESMNE